MLPQDGTPPVVVVGMLIDEEVSVDEDKEEEDVVEEVSVEDEDIVSLCDVEVVVKAPVVGSEVVT